MSGVRKFAREATGLATEAQSRERQAPGLVGRPLSLAGRPTGSAHGTILSAREAIELGVPAFALRARSNLLGLRSSELGSRPFALRARSDLLGAPSR